MADGQASVDDCMAYLRHTACGVSSMLRNAPMPPADPRLQEAQFADSAAPWLIHRGYQEAQFAAWRSGQSADSSSAEEPPHPPPPLSSAPQPADPCLKKEPADSCIAEEPPPPPWRQPADSCIAEEQPPPPWRQWRLRKSADSSIAEEPPHPPPPLSSAPQPVDQTRGSDRKRHRRITVDAVCADADCTKRCESQGCNWCAVHCPGLPRTSAICKSHYDFPGRCTELSVWCLNKHPVLLPCRDDKCASHCMDTACDRHFGPDKPTRPSTNRTRGLRTARVVGGDR